MWCPVDAKEYLLQPRALVTKARVEWSASVASYSILRPRSKCQAAAVAIAFCFNVVVFRSHSSRYQPP